MQKKEMCPVVIIAISALISCYGSYACAASGSMSLSTVYFFMRCAAIVSCIVIVASRCMQVKYKSFYATYHSIVRFALFSLIGSIVGNSAAAAAFAQRKPPHTLADIPSVCSIMAECIGEPVASGSDSYAVLVRLMVCNDKEGGQFSAEGTVRVIFPAALIRGSYAGSITKIGLAATKEKAVCYLPAWQQILPNGQERLDVCRFYARGMRFFVQGKFNRSGTHFFARPEHPLFLGWTSHLSHFRAFLRFYLMRVLHEWGECGGLLLALLAADKAFLSKECLEQFRCAGLAHVLALSGMHVSLISTAVVQSGKKIGGKKAALKIAFLAVVVFVWFAGYSPSLFRALIMMIVASVGKALSVPCSSFSVLCATVLVHVGMYGSDAFTLGFMLSYGACAGIILFGNAITAIAAGKVPPVLLQNSAASIGAQLFTFPIVMASIGSIAPAGIIASCVVSPFISSFLILGLFCLPPALLFPVCTPFFTAVFGALYKCIFLLTRFFAQFPLIQFSNAYIGLCVSCALFLIGCAFMGIAALVRRQTQYIL